MPEFSDDFDRPDGALGAPWTTAGAGTIAVVANQAKHTAGAATDFATVDAGRNNVHVTATCGGSNGGLALRYIDANNTLMVVTGTGSFDGLWKIVAGAAARIGPTAAILGGSRVTVTCIDDFVRVIDDGVTRLEYTLTAPEAAQFTTPTKFGLRCFASLAQTWDDFELAYYRGNIETYPADVPLSTAVNGFGLNLGSVFLQRWAYDCAKAHGATEVRIPIGWEFVEDFDNPGDYSAMAALDEPLQWCAELGLRPLLVAQQYGPPYRAVATVHVNGDHPVGSTTLTVDEDLSGLDFDLGYIFVGGPNSGLGKVSYHGGIVTAIDGSTISLGAATVERPVDGAIPDGTELAINRLLYPPVATDSGSDPSAIAYANFARALALKIAQWCPSGVVEAGNEPEWHFGRHDQMSRYFDDPAAHGVATWPNLMSPQIKAIAAAPDWPPEVHVVNSGTHKTGAHSALNVLPVGQLGPIEADAVHPYWPWDATFWWGEGPTCEGLFFGPGYQNVIGNSNFAQAAKQGDEAGFRRVITETGYGGTHPNPAWLEALKSYLVRHVVGAWSMGYDCVNVYSLADAPYPLVDEDRDPYPALARIGQLLRFLRTIHQDEENYVLPSIEHYDGELPLWRVNVGPALVCWQRSPMGAPEDDYEPSWPTPVGLRLVDVPDADLLVLNTVRRAHETASGPGAERRLLIGAEPLVVTWRLES